ncbi:MAG: Gfo/Idh/MocA family oxidoreductase [Armatimonadetes bacterium]|nr:Gfo/Idh/MocA family oxidoreductase [Armatimonadota bacterium]
MTRRDLLIGAGASVLAPGGLRILRDGPDLAPQTPDPGPQTLNSNPVGWAILGIGSYAQNQIMPNFAACKNAKLVALISGHQAKLDNFGDKYAISKKNRFLYDQMDLIKDNPEIEVVYVITPPSTHPDFAIRAAKLGKHICCEKPMAPAVADCQRMIDACKRAGKLMQIGYRSQYEAHNLRAIEMCRKGEIGRIKSYLSEHGFNIGRGQWRTQRALAGGGSMMDIGIYSLQALRYLSGEEPIEVTAKITNPPNDDRFVDCEDDVRFTLRLPSGIECHGAGGYSWSPGKSRFEVVGEKGTLLGEPATPYGGHRLTLLASGEKREARGDEPSAIAYLPFDSPDSPLASRLSQQLPITPNNQFVAQIEHFSECIRTGGKVKTPGEEGLRDIRIIQAIYESAASGKPVALSTKTG